MVELLVKGGWVMIPILICSVLAVAISLERLIRFWLINNANPYTTFEKVWQMIKKDDITSALSFCNKRQNPIVKVITTFLEHYEDDVVDIEKVVSHELTKSIQSLEKNLPSLAVIVHISPLLGLLGTVTGIIKAFMRVEAVGGRIDVCVLAGGIWEALLTTAFGLGVAILSLLMYHYLDSKVDRFTFLMKDISIEFFKLLKTKRERND